MRLPALLLILAVAPPLAHAQQAGANGPTRVLRAVPVSGEVLIDGRLDEPAWQRAPVAAGFVQQRPTPGAPASEATEVRVLFDSHSLYVGMRMFDSAPDSIAAQLGRRDAADLHADWAHVLIDSYLDRRTAFRFAVNPAGVKMDLMHFDDVREDLSWNAVWEVATHIDSLGWTAEFRIPFSQLRFTLPDNGEMVWGINFVRDIARRNERSFWSPVPPGTSRMVSLAGELHGLQIARTPARLELLPYTALRLDAAPVTAGDPFSSPLRGGANAGLDLMYGLGPNLTLNATINPDFGQVDVDPAVVNLTAFETFFPERRPFFLERADLFRFDLNIGGEGGSDMLFYSRRIGRAPRAGLPEAAVFSDVPSGSRILGAAKVTGRLNGWNVGFLNALSENVVARYVDAGGDQHRIAVEPLTNFAVARLARDYRDGTSGIGLMATAVNRSITEAHLGFLPSAAYAVGFHGRHRFWNNQWLVEGTVAGSAVSGSELAIARLQRSPARYFQRPDAEHVRFDPTRTTLSGGMARLQLARVEGRWRGGTILLASTPGFEVNDVGFQQATDLTVAGVYAGRLEFRPGAVFRTWNLFANTFGAWTFGGEPVHRAVGVSGGFELLSGWGGGGGIEARWPTLSMAALRGGPALLRSRLTDFRFHVFSDRRQPLRVTLMANGQANHEVGGGRIQISPSVTLRPAPWLSASAGPSIAWNRDHAQYVATLRPADAAPIYLHGRLDQTTLSLSARLNVTFTPDLTLEFFAQPFVSAGAYSEFTYVADPRARTFQERFAPYGGHVRDPSFNIRSFRGNAVLRWEYRPGSALFLVWQQQRSAFEPHGEFRFGRDFLDALTAPGQHIFLAKATFWWGR